jgi:hypothetical protein
MISHMPPAPRRNAAKIRSGTCSSDNNDNFVALDRSVMAGIGFISDKPLMITAFDNSRLRTLSEMIVCLPGKWHDIGRLLDYSV